MPIEIILLNFTIVDEKLRPHNTLKLGTRKPKKNEKIKILKSYGVKVSILESNL
jgi:hypothetical protein